MKWAEWISEWVPVVTPWFSLLVIFSFAGFDSRLFFMLSDFLSLLGIWRWPFSLAFPIWLEVLSSPILPPKIFSQDSATETLHSGLPEGEPQFPQLQRNPNFLWSVASQTFPSDHTISINHGYTKILPSHLQYFSFKINSFFYQLKELNPGKYLSISKVHKNLWRYSLWPYWALIKILAIIK